MQVKSIAECSKREHSAILSTSIKLSSAFKAFISPIFEWPLKTGFTVHALLRYLQECQRVTERPDAPCEFHGNYKTFHKRHTPLELALLQF